MLSLKKYGLPPRAPSILACMKHAKARMSLTILHTLAYTTSISSPRHEHLLKVNVEQGEAAASRMTLVRRAGGGGATGLGDVGSGGAADLGASCVRVRRRWAAVVAVPGTTGAARGGATGLGERRPGGGRERPKNYK
ncbi:hypothetical protein EVAR_14016_1 [Eumeta japonica]|uniref:Uncharacterized protein n=1 Tax=Eumeta variegata TaxID=151549 RepID=A0A4C1XCS9_EUMVA|nr:hypothetical protein EVAR_14016_1 [Eumeta japonica]